MEKEKLIIKNFGPIKHVELELGRFNVLIGESGTGKSTIAKLISFCRYFSNIEGGYFDEVTQTNKNLGLDNIDENLKKNNLYEFVNEDCLVRYECDYYIFEFSKRLWNSSSGMVQHLTSQIYPKRNEFKYLLDEYSVINHERYVPVEFYTEKVSSLLDFPFFIPTERVLQSTFSAGKDFTSNLSDSLFRYYVENDKIQKQYFKEETLVNPLKIYYRNVNGRAEVKKVNEVNYYNLLNGASGYQSAIPISLLIIFYTKIRKKRKTFLIEEPEQNLFPSAQYELMKFFAEAIKFHNGILLTTHSPYILTSLNNLMYAWQVGQENEAEVSKIIDKKYWVNPAEVSAYQLLSNGTAENIIAEDGLIMAENIDVISKKINEEYDLIQDIKLGIKQ